MAKILVVATSGAGGDLQPLVAAALALGRRGHSLSFLGDGSVAGALTPLGLTVDTLPHELDLGPRLIAAIKEAMTSAGGDLAAAGPVVQWRMAEWAEETAKPVGEAVRSSGADAAMTSLFGVEVLDLAGVATPWAVVNSTFYIGPNPPATGSAVMKGATRLGVCGITRRRDRSRASKRWHGRESCSTRQASPGDRPACNRGGAGRVFAVNTAGREIPCYLVHSDGSSIA